MHLKQMGIVFTPVKMEFQVFWTIQSAEGVEYINLKQCHSMAEKAPGGKKRRRKRKLRMTPVKTKSKRLTPIPIP